MASGTICGGPLGLPESARSVLLALAGQLDNLAAEVRNIERQLTAWHRQNAASQRLAPAPVSETLLERKPTRLVTVAIANKTARTAWAILAKGEDYNAVAAI